MTEKKTTVSAVVREIVRSDPWIRDALERNYGNITAISRLIMGQVQERVGNKVALSSVVTAVKRTRASIPHLARNVGEIVAKSVVSVRTHVAKLCLAKSKRNLEMVGGLLIKYKEDLMQVSESTSAITLIVNQTRFDEIRSMVHEQAILDESKDLAAIIVHSPEAIISTPMCAVSFYSAVSRAGVNMEDTVSCYTDTIMVVKMSDVAKSFASVTEMINTARREMAKDLKE